MGVDAFVPADQVPGDLVRDAGSGAGGLRINVGFDRQALGKIEGAPTAADPVDARREAYLAYELARRPDVDHVMLGEEAVRFMYPRGRGRHDQDVDVIARVNRTDLIVGDAKGEHFGRALVEQLPHSTFVLKSRGFNVVEGVVVALQPRTIIASWAMDHEHREWRQVGIQLPGIDPAAITNVNPNHPGDRRFVYLLDPGFHAVHNPTGLLIEPGVRFPLLRTHIHAPRLGDHHHMAPGVWSYIHPFTIPTTIARVRIGFVR